MATVRCECGASLKVPAGFKSGKCPKCGAAIAGAPSAVEPPSEPAVSPDHWQDAVNRTEKPRGRVPLAVPQWICAVACMGWFAFGFSGPSDIQLLGSWAIASGFFAAAVACAAARAVIRDARTA